MKSPVFRLPGGAISRADVLRALASTPKARYTLEDDGDSWFGYIQQPEPAVATLTDTVFETSPSSIAGKAEPAYKLPLQMPFVHVIADRQSRQIPAQNTESVPAQPQSQPETLNEKRAEPPSSIRLVSYQDLVPQARLMPALRRQLAGNRFGALDMLQLVQQIAAQALPRHLPRRRLQSWHPELVVILDFCQRLWPYREDMHRLAERLLSQCGQSGLSLRIVNHGPLGNWSDWRSHQNPTATNEPQEQPWRMPPAGTPVLIVSDLGLLLGAQSEPGRVWQQFITTLLQAQIRPVALMPLGAEQLDKSLPAALVLLRWSPDARSRPERAHASAQNAPKGLADLLAMAAISRRIDPPLLRAMRKINPHAALNAGLEGAFWVHADVQAGLSASIRPSTINPYLQHFAEQLKPYQAALETLRHTHHAHLRAALNHEETLLWRAHASVDTPDLTPEAQQRIVDAEQFMRQLAATLQQPNSLQLQNVWCQVAQEVLQRADRAMSQRYASLLTPLAAAMLQVYGNLAAIPDWVDPAAMAEHLKEAPSSVNFWLVRDPANGCVAFQRFAPVLGQSLLGGPFLLDSGGFRLETGDQSQWLDARTFYHALCPLSQDNVITLTTHFETINITTVQRPRGAIAWGCGEKGVWVQSPELCGRNCRWENDELLIKLFDRNDSEFGLRGRGRGFKILAKEIKQYQTGGITNSEFFKPIYHLDSSLTTNQFLLDEFGVMVNVNIQTLKGIAWQTLRWIEPGQFMMGSIHKVERFTMGTPDDEVERSGRESPRHLVTITQGFWLADSACTQALWQAVMGNNPSGFQGDPQCPVERVSWYDVQRFLRLLESLLPGCLADLPTEAEWEYACRAGTDTNYSFGMQISPEQVNYNGKYPYADGKPGLYREQTIPVKSLPANAWGLYEMHGNVWEWCRDGLRTYDEQAQRDPFGPVFDEDAPRAIRGGSWYRDASRALSAHRSEGHPGFSHPGLGFRFCLRPFSPGQEPIGPTNGASPDMVKTIFPSVENGFVDKLSEFFKPKSKPR